jgi:RNA polymerase sigma-70 factor (ECF subfamily)
LAWEQLIVLRRRHVRAQRRSILLEQPIVLALPDESATDLADRLVSAAICPGRRLLREELRRRVHQAFLELRENDREVLVLRYLEQLSVAETAAVLGISPGAVKVRHLRALERLRALLDETPSEGEQ